jgi:hypothetical protein
LVFRNKDDIKQIALFYTKATFT